MAVIKKIFIIALLLLAASFGAAVGVISFGGNMLAGYATAYLQKTFGVNLKVQDLDISLLHGKIQVSHLNLSDNQKNSVTFDNFSLDLSLRDAIDGNIIISDLSLLNPHLNHPAELFSKFSTAAPAPQNESPQPFAFKVPLVVENGLIEGLSLEEVAGEGRILSIEGASVSVHGNAAIKKMLLREQINKIVLTVDKKPRELGSLTAAQEITDNDIFIPELSLTGGELVVAANGVRVLPKLQGSIHTTVTTESFVPPEQVSIPLSISADLDGTVELPQAQFRIASTGKLIIAGGSFDSVALSGDFQKKPEGFSASVHDFDLDGSSGFVHITEPLIVTDKALGGKVDVNLGNLQWPGAGFESVKGNVALAGTTASPLANLNATIVGLRAGSLTTPVLFGPIILGVTNDGVSSIAIKADEASNPNGMLSLDAGIQLGEKPTLRTTNFKFERFLPNPKASLKGEISAEGPLTADGIKAKADFEGSYSQDIAPINVKASATLADGVVALNLNQEKAVEISGQINLAPEKNSAISFKIDQSDVARWHSGLECTRLQASGKYSFALNDAVNGEGSINGLTAAAGCGAQKVLLTANPLQIENGGLTIPEINLQTGAGKLKINGAVSQALLKLSAKGQLDFAPLNALAPSIEDLHGSGAINLAVSGTPVTPVLSGNIIVSDIGLENPEPAVEVKDLNARIDLSGSAITLSSLSGTVNDGQINASGGTNMSDPLGTLAAKLSFRSLYLQPVADTQITLSGDLALGTGEFESLRLPKVSGEVRIDDGLYEKNFDLTLVREKIASFFSSTGISLTAQTASAPSVLLDVAINGDSSFAVNTNLARAEIGTKLQLLGPNSDLAIKGVVLVPTGSFNVGSHSFEITSGVIRMGNPGEPPTLNILGESYMQDAEGFPLTVFMEVAGPATDPRVLLSSDNGLSQEALLKLVTAGQGFGEQSLFNSALSGAGVNNVSLLGQNTFLGALSRIDELTVEPSYNVSTGEVGSKLLTSERLTDDLKLSAELPFLGKTDQPQVSSSFQLFPFLSAKASLKIPQDDAEQSYAGDLNWTLISGEIPSPVSFSGNSQIGPVDLGNAIGVSGRTSLHAERIPILERRLADYYRGKSFLDVAITSTCEEKCQKVHFNIVEGQRYFVGGVEVDPKLQAYVTDANSVAQSIGVELATATFQQQEQNELVLNLRKHGFARARLESSYRKTEGDKAVLQLGGRLKDRYVFQFTGNKEYSEKTLLEAYRYYERTLPFTAGFPDEFRRFIETYYHERGFAYAGVALYIGHDDDATVLTYDTAERRPTTISAVRLSNSPLTKENFKKILSSHEYKTIFEPGLFNPDAAHAGTLIITNSLRQAGFPSAVVTLDEEKLDDFHVRLVYRINAGAEKKFTIAIKGLPADVQYDAPTEAQPADEVKRISRNLQQTVRQAGYFDAQTSFDLGNNALINVIPGKQRTIGAVTIIGYERIQLPVITQRLALHEGDVFTWKKLSDSRRDLYRSGLFQKIDFTFDDTGNNKEIRNVLMTVREKPLNSLSLTTGYDSTYGIHLGINGIDRNFFADGRELSARADVYYDMDEGGIGRGFGVLRFRDPQLQEDTAWTEELGFLKSQNSRYQEFNNQSVFLRSEIQQTVTPKFNLKANHLLEHDDISGAPQDIILSDLDSGQLLLSILGAGAFYTDQDDPLNPRSARRGSVEAKLSSGTFGSDADFLTILPKVSFLQPTSFFDDRLSIFGGLQGGISKAMGDTSEIPISRRFYLGGQDSVRGYEENSLGPRGSLGDVIGGDRYYAGSGELRYQLLDKVTVLTFIDAGRVWLQSLDRDKTRVGTGFGGRYSSPIGSLGVDVGFPVGSDEKADAYELYFRIGATF